MKKPTVAYVGPSILVMACQKMWIAPDWENHRAGLFEDPDRLFSHPDCRMIKDQRKVKVACVPLLRDGKVVPVYLKRYNAFSWRYRLGSLFLRSEAYRSWVGAAVLRRAGFHVGQPVAAVEHRRYGILEKSFYLSMEVKNGLTVDGFWDLRTNELQGKTLWAVQKSLLKELAQLFSSLHAKGIYHRDLKDANILVQEQEGARRYYLTDLEQVSSLRVSERRRVKNLVQLNRTLGKRFSRGRRLFFLREYLGERYLDRSERRRWVGKVVAASRRADVRSLVKAGQPGFV